MHRIFLASAVMLLTATASFAESDIDTLIEETNIVPGPVAMRDVPSWDATRKIIVRDIGFDRSELTDGLDGADLVFVSSSDEALALAPEAGAIIGYCSEELFAAAPHLSWVQIYSAGAERCLASAPFSSNGIVLTNGQKMSSPVIAEHAIAMLLNLTRNLSAFSDDMEKGEWRRSPQYTDRMTPIAGKTMLVLGLGGIGTEIARRGAALGMRVIGTRNSSREGPDFVDYVGLADEMISLAAEADVIVNALPLTDTTRGLLDAEFFAPDVLKRQPYFINVGRGATVDTDALLSALDSGVLAGAGLDVTDPEPLPPDHPLWQSERVLITPHVSSRGSNTDRRQTLARENILRFLAGDALFNVVDPDKGY